MSYLDVVADFYGEVAREPVVGLCCVGGASLELPELRIPAAMLTSSYGCGSTVAPGDLAGRPTVVYVGVGGGKEALQFAYFSRRPGGVIAIEPVSDMRAVAARNLAAAIAENPWFDPSFVEVRDGDAFALPVPDASADVVAQNCVFNIFSSEDFMRALGEARRVLRPGGRLSMSDPIALAPLPEHLRADDRLRAMCLGGAVTYDRYVAEIVRAGFGQIEIRRRRPYRVLDRATYGLPEPIALESIDLVAFAVPVPDDGPCIFTGRTATYVGSAERYDDGRGHVLERGVPVGVCDKTAAALGRLEDVLTTPPTWHYDGGGCC